jgi:N,N'-diacetyllegionaminate synthase
MSTIEIVAELAQGFEGDVVQAALLVKAAAAAGADAAKFQMVYADELAAPDYQHYRLFSSLELDDHAWDQLMQLATRKGVALQADVFGPRSLALAERLGIQTIKLHPTDVANRGLLTAVAASAIPRVLLGAGGTHLAELTTALELLAKKAVVVLLGFQGYPTATEDNQIARVSYLREWLHRHHPQVAVGFADHAAPESPLRYALAAVAVGAGASVIEKHLTLGRNMQLEDHESALNPDEFGEFVATIRACHAAMGMVAATDDLGMSAAEDTYRRTIRRHVVATRHLAAGTRLSPDDVGLKRTGASHPLTDLDAVYGRELVRAVAANGALTEHDFTREQ